MYKFGFYFLFIIYSANKINHPNVKKLPYLLLNNCDKFSVFLFYMKFMQNYFSFILKT